MDGMTPNTKKAPEEASSVLEHFYGGGIMQVRLTSGSS